MNFQENWKRKIINQGRELIGTTKPGEGNGYHDRISFDTHIYNPYTSVGNTDHWLHSVYFRDLLSRINPVYKKEKQSLQDSIKISNCSKEYINTFYLYLESKKGWKETTILNKIEEWAWFLVHHGKVVLEFVGWYDNSTNDLYGFELQTIDSRFIDFKENKLFINAFDHELGYNKAAFLPTEKCIIIEWPEKLGGLEYYNHVNSKVLELGSKLDISHQDPGENLKRMREWDIVFNTLTSKWGTNHPLKETTEFYQQFCYLKFWGSAIYCFNSLVDIFKKLILFLNKHLGEEAIFTFDNDMFSIVKYEKTMNEWLLGEKTFKEVNSYMFDNK